MKRARLNTQTQPAPSRAKAACLQFMRDEDGSLIVLSVFIFLTMLATSAITFDFVRQEQYRKKVQSAADRAALASSDLSQTRSPDVVVKDYFAKEGLTGFTPVISYTEASLNSAREVTISVNTTVNRTFAGLLAPEIDTLPVKAYSKAEEAISQVEMALVLDVSGSMVDPDDLTPSGKYRLDELKPAAVSFVTKLFAKLQPAGSPLGRLSISIVPYNQQVALGREIQETFTINTNYSIPAVNPPFTAAPCVDFSASDFNSTAINPSSPLTRTMYGDSWDMVLYRGGSRATSLSSTILATYGYQQDGLSGRANYLNCYNIDANKLMPYATDLTKIKNKINGLQGGGATAIDFGAKWGLALLDPAARPAINSMVTKGYVVNEVSDRPMDYDDETLKVMVLMTDGANTDSYSTLPAWRTGNSPLVSTISANNLNGLNPTTFRKVGIYYYDATNGSTPYYSYNNNAWYSLAAIGGKTYPITYEYLYQYARWNLTGAAEVFRRPFGRTLKAQFDMMAFQSEDSTTSGESDKDGALLKLCDLARKQGVLVFTLAVDAPTQAGEMLQSCATTPAYAHDISSSSLDTAFNTIVASIKDLRLTN